MTGNVSTYVRFLHAVPNAPAVDLYVGDKLVGKGITYKSFTEYLGAYPGVYNIKLYPAGNKSKLLLEEDVQLQDGIIYTIAVAGVLQSLDFKIIVDKKRDFDKSKTHIRFINLSPFDTKFDILLDGAVKITDLDYEEVSNYIELEPRTYYIKVLDSYTKRPVLLDPKATLRAGKLLAGYIVGQQNKGEGLEILIPLEKAGY